LEHTSQETIKLTEHIEPVEPVNDNMLNTPEGARKEEAQRTEEEKKKEEDEIKKIMEENIQGYRDAFNKTLSEIMMGTGGETNAE